MIKDLAAVREKQYYQVRFRPRFIDIGTGQCLQDTQRKRIAQRTDLLPAWLSYSMFRKENAAAGRTR